MTTYEVYECDMCEKQHKEPNGLLWIESIGILDENGECKNYYCDLSFCSKECLKTWIDENIETNIKEIE